MSTPAPDPRGREPPLHRGALPPIGNLLALMRDPTRFQREGHRQHGPVFATSLFGLRLVFADGDEALQRMLWARTEELSLVAAYRVLLGRLLGEDLFVELSHETLKGLSAASLRRQSAALARFAAASLREHVAEASSHARGGGGGTTELDAVALCGELVFDLACWYVCGPDVPADVRRELARLVAVIESDYSVVGMFLPIETPAFRRRVRARERLLALFGDVVLARLRAPRAEPDYMHSLIEERRCALREAAGGGEASEAALVEAAARSVMGVIFGAQTNSAMTLAACLDDLLAHPRWLAAARDEIAAEVGAGEISIERLARMPTLFRCINETLRRRSNGGLWRRVMRPIELGGYTLREGTLVGTSMGLINLAPERYAEPSRYDPDRFRAVASDEFHGPAGAGRSLSFGAFGAGRHVCPGRSVAYVMLGTTLATLLRDYDLTPVRRPWWWFDMVLAGLARPVGAFRLALRPRPALRA